MRKYFLGVAGVGFLIFLGLRSLDSTTDSFLSGACDNEIKQTIISPDKSHKLVIFNRDCGATTDFSTQISLLKSSAVLANQAGNIFAADANHGTAPAAIWGGPRVWVKWTNALQVIISYDKPVRVFLATPIQDGISFDYHTK